MARNVLALPVWDAGGTMSLLDDARRLAGHDPVAAHDFGFGCQFCGGRADIPYGGDWKIDHKRDCPWLSMSNIVAVLEAAEQIRFAVGEYPEFDDYNRVRVDLELLEILIVTLQGDD